MGKDITGVRCEKRIPLAMVVSISGHRQTPCAETTFTENVSAHGARVLTVLEWRLNDRLEVAALPGDFHAQARVAYCHPLRDEGYAIGLEFLEPAGHGILSAVTGSENNLHG